MSALFGLQSIDIIIGLGGIATLALLFFALWETPDKANAQRIAKLQERYVHKGKSAETLSLRRQGPVEEKGVMKFFIRMLPSPASLANRLERAGSRLTPQRFLLRGVAIIGVCGGLALAVGKPPLLGVFLGIILGLWLPLKLLQRRIDKQLQQFLKLFPDAIDLIVRGLRSGLPVAESITLVSREVPAPVGSTFAYIGDTMKLGVSLEKALQDVAARMRCNEFNFFTTCITLQRETGGNLSEILSNLSEVLRARFMLKMKIKAMTSEARASSMIIGVLPFLVSALLLVASPDYLKPLWTDARGNVAAGIAITMLTFGIWSMKRMARFEI